jgi:hypothetical protein
MIGEGQRGERCQHIFRLHAPGAEFQKVFCLVFIRQVVPEPVGRDQDHVGFSLLVWPVNPVRDNVLRGILRPEHIQEGAYKKSKNEYSSHNQYDSWFVRHEII